MSIGHAVQDLSFPVKVYVGIIHLLLLFLVVLFLQRPYKKRDGGENSKQGRKRTFTKDNRAVTIESCEWINSTLAWFYIHSNTQANDSEDLTPNVVKLWIRALNRQLQKDRKKNPMIVIDALSSGCLPPKVTSVYCLSVSGNMQCITFHVESADLGFLIRVLHQTDKGPQASHFETRVIKLTGEVAFKLVTASSKLEVSVQFIGVPEIVMSTKCLTKGSEVDAVEVQEKVKEVICKTITSIPLTDATSRERLNSDENSTKDKLDSPSSVSCAGEEGKLLVKVIKASGLCGKDKTGPISPYCIISTNNPLQRKRTSMVSDNDSPFWNEYFTFDITRKTTEITLDIYNYERTENDANGHMDDNELTEEQDDYLGQVIVPLSTVNRDQTCRLILPILPKSSKSEHSKGEISLEFTFDKDGKVIDVTLPIINGLERSGNGRPSAHSSPTEETPSIHINGVEYGTLNGHVSPRKRYLESSLDELAMEIEAYEHDEEGGPKENGYHGDEEVTEAFQEPEPQREPVSPAVEVSELETAPAYESEDKDDDELLAMAELIKSTEAEEEEEMKDEETTEKADVTDNESKETADEKQEEEKLKDIETEEEEEKEKEQEEEKEKEQEEKGEEPSLKPKHRRSFNLFKRRKVDKKAEEQEEEDEAHETEKKEDTLEVDEQDGKEVEGEDEKKDEKTEEEETAAESDTKPKARRSFKLFKRKPHTVAEEVESQEEVKKEELSVDGKEEPKEENKVEETKEEEGDEEKAKGFKESAEQDGEFDRKPKARRSFNLFKRRPQSAAVVDEVETQEEGKKDKLVEESKEGEAESQKAEDVNGEKNESDREKEKEQEESVEAFPEFDAKPKMRRSFNMFKRRPQSMAAADRKTNEDSEEGALSRNNPVRHSYHGGDLPVPDASNLHKSTSQSSLLSYSPNPRSTLVIETITKGEKKYSHIPPLMAKRGAYERGNKLHIYNNHIFTAVHFTGSLPQCAVCGKPLKGLVGKQGYQCRGCKMVTHRACHSETTEMCSSDAVKHMSIEYVGDTDV
ncbi:uncharacterized protein LOC141891908 isoform X4 [Acropora palmata]|uniref:uncharacterized protein LOC141891908 isoform X4 n=1 Tax=Acropora palmata TaxID=6131 RepID=UPI003DA0467A